MPSPRLIFLYSLCLIGNLLAVATQAQTSPSSAARPELAHPLGGGAAAELNAATPKSRQRGAAKEIPWEALVPPDWNPAKEFEGMNLSVMSDGDPRATSLLKRMREVWDQAPINEKMDGAFIRIPGYVVPLEESKEGMKEFLLVPYYGACIHSPPPPANQIIHVISSQPVRGLRSMETVWVQGKLQSFRHDSLMGVSGYRIAAPVVEPYVDKGNKGNR